MSIEANRKLLYDLAVLLENNKQQIAEANSQDVLTSLQTNIDNIDRGISTLKSYAILNISATKKATDGVAIFSCYGDPSFGIFGMTLAPAILAGGSDIEILLGFPVILKKYGALVSSLIKESALLPNFKVTYGAKQFMNQTLANDLIGHCVVFGEKWVNKYVDQFKNKKSLTYYGPGNNAAVILSEDNIEEAIDNILESAFILSGQVAVALNRCIIDNRIDKVKVAALFYHKLLKITSGFEPSNYVTPICAQVLVDLVKERIQDAENKEAIISNYSITERKGGVLISPTLVWLQNTNADIWTKYHFAPVLPMAFLDFEDIAKEVNNTEYGIYSTIWGNENEIDQISAEITKEHIMVLKNQSILDIMSVEKGYTGPWCGFKDAGFCLSKETNWEPMAGSFNFLDTITK